MNYAPELRIIDIGDSYIELVENFSCSNKSELQSRENYHMRSMDCVNKQLAIPVLVQYHF